MLKRLLGKGSGSGSRDRDRGSGSGSRDQDRGSGNGSGNHGSGSGGGSGGHGSGSSSVSGGSDSGCRDRGYHWGMAGSEKVQPDTAERLRETVQFQADDPATSTTAEFASYRDFTPDVDTIPLPYAASRTRSMCEKHHPIAVQRYRQLSDDVIRRVAEAREQIARKKGTAIYEKVRRAGNKAITKRPPPGRRVILEWSDSPRVPIGEWATRFNNMIGCLVKRADFINTYFRFNQQPFKSFEEIWQELMKSYCLEDHPYTWVYLFGANGKVSSLLSGWRFDLKTEYYSKIYADWERFWKLDNRVDTHHFGALFMLCGDPNNMGRDTAGSTSAMHGYDDGETVAADEDVRDGAGDEDGDGDSDGEYSGHAGDDEDDDEDEDDE